ncbi:hypothetical protein BD289DRAFT_439026 [Coniella lustricola]|uniref:Condensation domain-containing protein n=1 Tax=Coniella lustricola TaxID=2025994 RepID=A0A2T3A279_9PEZI|nr:hypothetical protein BD289DRAFT_439026 [Coniella lustricola]
MSWAQTTPGHWQRQLGENERMIKWIGDQAHSADKEQWSIHATGTFVVSATTGGGVLTGESNELWQRMRRAWMCLRFQHPGMASTADQEGQMLYYNVPSDSETLEAWADESLHRLSMSPPTAIADLVASLGHAPYTIGYFIPDSGQFLLHTSHWRTDGYGVLQLLAAFFEAVAADDPDDPKTLAWGEEPSRLAPSIEEVLELPKEPTNEIRRAAALCLASGRHVLGSIGLPFRQNSRSTSGSTRSLRRSLPQTVTNRIMVACEDHGIGLQAAVHASLAVANFYGGGLAGNTGAQKHYTSNIRFSLRPYLKPPFNSARYAAALYTGSYMAKVDALTGWKDAAAYYDHLYREGLNTEFLLARRQFAIQALGMMQAAAARSGGEAAPLVRSEIDISSVGDAEVLIAPVIEGRGRRVLKIEVLDISLGLECQTQETYLFVWVFKGKLELNLVYNEGFYTADFMGEMLDIVVSTLQKELHASE